MPESKHSFFGRWSLKHYLRVTLNKPYSKHAFCLVLGCLFEGFMDSCFVKLSGGFFGHLILSMKYIVLVFPNADKLGHAWEEYWLQKMGSGGYFRQFDFEIYSSQF